MKLSKQKKNRCFEKFLVWISHLEFFFKQQTLDLD